MIAFYALWCGFCWVLRGGKYGDVHRYLFGREPGTTVTRLVCASLMAAPLAVAFDPVLIVLWLSIYVAMTIGYFDESMGLEQPGRDHVWLALWGWAVGLLALAPLYLRFDPARFALPELDLFNTGLLQFAANALFSALGAVWVKPAIDVSVVGSLSVLAYAINKPFGRRFGTDWTERAEFLTGVAMGAALFLASKGA